MAIHQLKKKIHTAGEYHNVTLLQKLNGQLEIANWELELHIANECLRERKTREEVKDRFNNEYLRQTRTPEGVERKFNIYTEQNKVESALRQLIAGRTAQLANKSITATQTDGLHPQKKPEPPKPPKSEKPPGPRKPLKSGRWNPLGHFGKEIVSH